jgi:hypothetical protein
MRRLDGRHRAGRARLHVARGRGAAVRRLSRASAAAARSLAARRAPIGGEGRQRSIERSLRALASSYRRLTAADRRQNNGGYRYARRAIARREHSLRRILRRL